MSAKTTVEIQTLFVDGPVSSAVVNEARQEIAGRADIGAQAQFIGQVRADPIPPAGSNAEAGANPVTAIEFTAHRELAQSGLEALCGRVAEETGPDVRIIRVWHGLGRIAVGQAPIAIIVGSGHRQAGFACCSAILEALKAEVPIFGREIRGDGSSVWKTASGATRL